MTPDLLNQPITIQNIIRDPYCKDDFLFEKDELTLIHKIIVLAGPNGYGKTSLITMLKESLEQAGAFSFENDAHSRNLSQGLAKLFDHEELEHETSIGFISYDSHNDDYSNAISSALLNKNPILTVLRKESSEGENNLISLGLLFNEAQDVVNEHPNLKQLIIFVDGIDSGLSVDKISFIIDTLPLKIKQIEELRPEIEVALVFTANNYEFVRDLPTIDPITFEKLDYHDYEEFRTDMLQKAKR
jgi:hypothetical protein|nr:MAG TPA: RNase L inhibitor binding cassette protein [Caudoviricetes sp.]